MYAVGSRVTALSPNVQTSFLGWSVIEGLAAVLVIPAIAALVADSYQGRGRITTFAIIGAVSGASVAAGPLIGGFVTTYFDWRYVFVAEVVMSVALSSAVLVPIVFGMLQRKAWGGIIPVRVPVVGGVAVTPLGTALISSILTGALSTSFAAGVAESDLPERTQMLVRAATEHGVTIVAAAAVPAIAAAAGLSVGEAEQLTEIRHESQQSTATLAG